VHALRGYAAALFHAQTAPITPHRLFKCSMDAPSAHTAEIVYARAILGAEMSSIQMKIARQGREEND
jgi:hypothetical protein